jgi:hypothetical protein
MVVAFLHTIFGVDAGIIIQCIYSNSEREKRIVKDMNITTWVSVSICFVLIILALIALSTPIGIILITGITGIIVSISLFFMEVGGESGGRK